MSRPPSIRAAPARYSVAPWAPLALAIFFGSGAALVAASCLLPGRTAPAYALGASAVAAITAVLLVATGRSLGARPLNMVLALGTVLIGSVVYSSGRVTSPDAILFVWVVLFGGFFFPTRALVLHTAFVGMVYGAVLSTLSARPGPVDAAAPQHLLLVTGGVTVAAVWIAALRRSVRTLIRRREELARTDPLTGLANRAELLARGDLALDLGTPTTEPPAIVLVDLDDFKIVNDGLGHHVGDQLLREVSARLRACAPPGSLVARLGGDEFAVLVPTPGAPDGIALLMDEMFDHLLGSVRIDGEDVTVRASAGLALADGHVTLEDLLRDADLAMYAAKAAGGGRWSAFATEMRDGVRLRQELDRDLRLALERDELFLHFQPVLHAHDRSPYAAEALVRWRHPVRGLVPPDEFIPAAEAGGLIIPLGNWVLREALRQAASWPRAGTGPAPVAVNLSARQLLHPGLVEEVRDALAQSGLDGGRLMLEVTETIAMADPERAVLQLEALRDLGITIAIDDFGTGHSSLEYLRRLPATVLKLARPFVRDVDRADGDPALARGIVELAHAIGKTVVAEGVEREGEAHALTAMGCDYLQGYLLGRPSEGAPVASALPAGVRGTGPARVSTTDAETARARAGDRLLA